MKQGISDSEFGSKYVQKNKFILGKKVRFALESWHCIEYGRILEFTLGS